jgi:hypothetical protein
MLMAARHDSVCGCGYASAGRGAVRNICLAIFIAQALSQDQAPIRNGPTQTPMRKRVMTTMVATCIIPCRATT